MTAPLAARTGLVLHPDPTRVVTTMFLPGQEALTRGASRATSVLDRILGLSDVQVERILAQTMASFGLRHDDLAATFDSRFELIAHRLDDPGSLSAPQRRLVGAYFSQEYAVESAALFNPSMVAHLDQSGLPAGATRFVMSVRAVGEGHISSIEWRTGTIDADDRISVDEPARPLVTSHTMPTVYVKSQIVRQLEREVAQDAASATYVLAGLPDTFSRAELDAAISALSGQGLTRGPSSPAIELLERSVAAQYTVQFLAGSELGQRVLMPTSPSEARGMEDLRLVGFTESDGTPSYRGTYTAFDGARVTPALLHTPDLRTFHSHQPTGPAAQDKGMALFPRAVGGRYLALSRWDRESTSLASSQDLGHWELAGPVRQPRHPWEIVHVGNCGSPLETAGGWLVLTHGVGPMRRYGIGAMLLDLDDPRIVLGSLAEPLLSATEEERDGYVPNVVYSCGSLIHRGTLVVPYGCSDSSIRIALVDLDALLGRLV